LKSNTSASPAGWAASAADAGSQPALALEVARAQRLVKGYGDTHARGWGNFQKIMAKLPQLQAMPQGPAQLKALVAAALADDSGRRWSAAGRHDVEVARLTKP
jgi:indolepyruvate ferredoxin oxidoreductase beta subunit